MNIFQRLGHLITAAQLHTAAAVLRMAADAGGVPHLGLAFTRAECETARRAAELLTRIEGALRQEK